MSITSDEIFLWEEEIGILKEMTKKLKPTDNLIALYGSSSLRLWTNAQTDLPDYQIINLAFGGSTYRSCDYYFSSLFDSIYPSHVLLYAGDNDLGNDLPENEILKSLDLLLSKLEAKYGSIPISIISVKPSPARLSLRKKTEHLNSELMQRSHQLLNGHFVDIYHPMLDENGKIRRDLYQEDLLHMNSKGYMIWKDVITYHLNNLSHKVF